MGKYFLFGVMKILEVDTGDICIKQCTANLILHWSGFLKQQTLYYNKIFIILLHFTKCFFLYI
jgi:hypothetical protein